MWELLETIENSGFATFVRETPSVLGYSTVLALHTFGMAFLVGLSGLIALRVLGFFRMLPMKPLEKFFPLIVAGFWLNAATGLVLTSLAARSLLTNWDFYVKLAAIVAAVVSLRQLKDYAFHDASSAEVVLRKGKYWATAMLACWGIAILAGRLTAYTNSVRRQTIVAVVVAVAALVLIRFVALRVAYAFRNSAAPVAKGAPAAHAASSNF
jgi:hypothetical protein